MPLINLVNYKNMPNMNGTGPLGQGAGTGWGQGACGTGLRRGRGCFGRRQFASPKNELAALEAEEKVLLNELEVIKAEKEALATQK